MHIVLIHRYFWPDTPLYASLLRDLAVALTDGGHSVSVLTSEPSYTGAVRGAPLTEDLAPGVHVRRVRLPAENRETRYLRIPVMMLFCAKVLRFGLALEKVDVVMAATAPPIVAAWTGSRLARLRGAAFVYHNQDVYPEVAATAGLLRSRLVFRVFRWADTRNDRRADRIVVLSQDMAQTVKHRGVPPERIVVINNFDPGPDADRSASPRAEPRSTTGQPMRVTFVGNLGRFQNLMMIVRTAHRLAANTAVVFDIVGDGQARRGMEAEVRRLGLSNVEFHGYWPSSQVETYLRERADLGLVTLLPGVVTTAFPSKTLSYLKQGCPVLATVEAGTDLARLLTEAGVGFAVEPDDDRGLADMIETCAADRRWLEPMRRAARHYYEEELTRSQQLDKWLHLFSSIENERFTNPQSKQKDK